MREVPLYGPCVAKISGTGHAGSNAAAAFGTLIPSQTQIRTMTYTTYWFESTLSL